MDAVSALSPNSTQTGSAPNGFSALSSEDFVKIMFTELSKQDPLKPNDSSALLEQMSSLRTIQSNIDLSNKLDALVAQNEFSSAGTLIGKLVSGLNEGGARVVGQVSSISKTKDGPVLNLSGGQRVAFSSVDEIVAPVSRTDGPTDTGGTGGSH